MKTYVVELRETEIAVRVHFRHVVLEIFRTIRVCIFCKTEKNELIFRNLI